MATATQENRALVLETDLGKDTLLVEQVTGREALSRLFEYRVQAVSNDDSVKFDDLMGTKATICMEVTEGGAKRTRHLNGVISQAAFVGHFGEDESGNPVLRYELILVPSLWLLTRTSDCKIFQEQSALEIIKEILNDNGVTDYEDRTKGTYEPREYCVQYGETDFNFIQRLMEHEGIHYFFEHVDGVHKLILGDDMSAHKTVPGYETALSRPERTGVESKPSVYRLVVAGRGHAGGLRAQLVRFRGPGALHHDAVGEQEPEAARAQAR